VNLLLLASHAVAEYDDVRMFADMGIDVFAPGGYADPAHPGESAIRPPLPNAPDHPELRALCDAQREKHAGDDPYMIDWAKADVHPVLFDWADVIVVHHFPERWIPQLVARGGKRVIWRTCGQSNPSLEQTMRRLRPEGLEVVRYSPAERRGFGDAYAGEDALIRFGKYPDDYGPWIGDWPVVGNVTQDMVARGDACGLGFWKAATAGLPVLPAGKGSEAIGGAGVLSYPQMLDYLRHIRVYAYTGTQPASYTLGLIEAMLSGVPVVSIDPASWGTHGDPNLFEGAEIVVPWDIPGLSGPAKVRTQLRTLLDYPYLAMERGRASRQRAVDLFGIANVARQWAAFLGTPERMFDAVALGTQPQNVQPVFDGVAEMVVPVDKSGGAA